MSDKEFDKLFRDKFASLEMEPSAAVWSGIAEQLDGDKKKKKPFPVFWMAAAGLVAVISAALLFMPSAEPIKLYGRADADKDNIEKAVVPAPVVQETQQITSPAAAKNKPVSFVEKTDMKAGDKQVASLLPAEDKKVKEPVTATTAQNAKDPVIESYEVEYAKASETSVRHTPEAGLMLASAESGEDTAELAVHQRTRIKSVGDLVNFVVGKVDKRKDKVIEFSENDEGSVVSGLNLGLVQFKKKE